MKKLLFLICIFSGAAFAGNPHSFDVVPKLLDSKLVRDEVAKYPNYYFNSITFEEFDDAWTEHVFTLVLSKHSGRGAPRVCFWVDYNEKIEKPVTRITKFEDGCEN